MMLFELMLMKCFSCLDVYSLTCFYCWSMFKGLLKVFPHWKLIKKKLFSDCSESAMLRETEKRIAANDKIFATGYGHEYKYTKIPS